MKSSITEWTFYGEDEPEEPEDEDIPFTRQYFYNFLLIFNTMNHCVIINNYFIFI